MSAAAEVCRSDIVERFVDAAIERRSAQVQQILRDMIACAGAAGTIEQLLAPAQVRVGQLWLAAVVTSADEHRVSAAVDEALDRLERDSEVVPLGPALVVSTGVDDWHATAARMAVLRLRAVGWDARFVGVSLDAARLEQARELGPIEAVGLSCVAAPHLLGVARSIRIAHDAGVPVMVGGQAFAADPRRARRLGAGAGPDLEPPPSAVEGSWLAARSWQQPPGSVSARLDALLELDLGIVAQQLLSALADERLVADASLAAALLRPAVDAWASAVAVDEPAIVTDQLAWTARYLAARGEPLDHVQLLAAGMQAVLPFDPGGVLRSASAPR